MVSPRLTGLDFHWFGKGQFLATRFQHGEAMSLDAATAALAAAVSEEARGCFAGPESLRRVSARFLLDADAVAATNAAPSSLDRIGAERRVKALRRLAASFESAAVDVEVWKRQAAHRPGVPANTP